MRRILLPLDGSELANRAIPFAVALAKRADQPISLLRAADASQAPNTDDGLLKEHDAAITLDAVAQTLAAQGVRTEMRVVEDPPDVAILSAAAEPGVSLVVMSTHGRGGLDRWLHGSVADAVLRDAPVPVLVVPPQGLAAWSPDEPPKILVPLDGSDRARTALGPASELADLLGGSLVLATVVPFPQYVAYAEGYAFVEPDPYDAVLTEMQAHLESLAATLRTPQRAVEVSATYGSPYSGVTAIAEEFKAALIVMATHGRGGVARALLGSVATATLRQAGVPILLVRPDEVQQLAPSMFGPASTGATVGAARASEEAAAPAPVAAGLGTVSHSIELAVSADELALLTRALGQQFYNEPVDPRHTEPARRLLEKLRTARGKDGTPQAPAASRQ